MDKTLILNKIQEALMFNVDAEFAEYLGISRQRLAGWKARSNYNAQILHTKCPDINPMFILKGQEPILADEATAIVMNSDYRELTEEESKSSRVRHQLWQEFQDECYRREHLYEEFPPELIDFFSKRDKGVSLQNEKLESETFKDKLIASLEERIKELKEYIELLKEKVK